MRFSFRTLLSLAVLLSSFALSSVHAHAAGGSTRYSGRIEFETDTSSARRLERPVEISLNPEGCAGSPVTFSELRWGNVFFGKKFQQVTEGAASPGIPLGDSALPARVRRALRSAAGDAPVNCGLRGEQGRVSDTWDIALLCKAGESPLLHQSASLVAAGASRIRSWSGTAVFSYPGHFGQVQVRRSLALARFSDDRVIVSLEGANRPLVGRVQRFEGFFAEGRVSFPGVGEIPVRMDGSLSPVYSSGDASLGFGTIVERDDSGARVPFMAFYDVQPCERR